MSKRGRRGRRGGLGRQDGERTTLYNTTNSAKILFHFPQIIFITLNMCVSIMGRLVFLIHVFYKKGGGLPFVLLCLFFL